MTEKVFEAILRGVRMLQMRRANIIDHEFLVRIDLKNDGYTVSDEVEITEQEREEHSKKIERFLTDSDKGAFIIDDSDFNKPIAMIMYSIANRDSVYPWTIFHELDEKLFQSDGRFMEIFQLWVHPNYRRLGLATKLKLKLEEESQHHQVDLIYTHTEEANRHVIELNEKIGYKEVRRGPIWDEVIRVSLIKKLTDDASVVMPVL
ncbi:GNAT family N-acetyltransferase [Paenibacillus sp. NEAU-GSW1]|uniref:GNAT family N-acetyltransferase n=1 Tax=Paenibacillus sp. NEAU-GSW1 TaxID=2682486 RepID=UPI0012E0DBFA|nr:GNAT family N-acetyltransferase [Paenibacillus sp. NEAU-GSW1]MUT67447.1 GNAT family N-acetyltransferase [Paenibacillus sp. NEAU-GSW1]